MIGKEGVYLSGVSQNGPAEYRVAMQRADGTTFETSVTTRMQPVIEHGVLVFFNADGSINQAFKDWLWVQ